MVDHHCDRYGELGFANTRIRVAQRRVGSGFALFHGSTAFRHLASILCFRCASDILKLSSRGANGRVISMNF
jgi:hypothetical protein